MKKFREYPDVFKKEGIDLNDPIQEKENRILRALIKFNRLKENYIRDIIKLNPKIHLNRLIQKGLIKKVNDSYEVVKKGKIIYCFEDFFTFYKNHQKSQKNNSNEFYYSNFPYVSKGTIRGWISKAKTLLK